MTYLLSLGSNLGNPGRNLARARRLLEKAGLDIVRSSSVYFTEPVDRRDQPWFLNQVLEVRSELRPARVLRLAKGIETGMGRRPGPAKGPRTIDIDILFAGSLVVESPDLTVPHPGLPGRNFVLVPLLEIVPGFVHPVLGRTIEELARTSPDASAVLRMPRSVSRGSGARSRRR